MTLTSKLKKIRDAFGAIDIEVYHYFHLRTELPYIIWEETGEAEAFDADNRKHEQAIAGDLNYYTKTEFDENIDLIQETFDNIEGLSYYLNVSEYDDRTNTIRYQWIWRIV